MFEVAMEYLHNHPNAINKIVTALGGSNFLAGILHRFFARYTTQNSN
jgi:hypothetical protein